MKILQRISKAALALVVAGVTVLGDLPVTPVYTNANASAATALTDADFLQAKGRNLRNNNGTGDIVQLKGTNLGGWMIQEFWMTPTESSTNVTCEADIYTMLTSRFGEEKMNELVTLYQDNYLTEADFDVMAAMGMNCVRLSFWWRNLVDASGTPYSNCFEKMDWAVEMAKARGMYVIIDFHGAPGSQNGSDHSGVDGGDDKEGASEFFWGSNASANQELYYEIWEMVAAHYKDEPAVAGYDLLNEPYCTYRYSSSRSADELHTLLWNIYDTAYDRIRAIDPNHVIIMEATWDPVDLPDPDTYGWENIMYEYHNYLYGDDDNAAGKQITNMENKLNAIRTAAYDVPSYMGEFCYFNNLDAWDEGLKLLNDSGINWTTWTYKVISEYGNWGLVNQSVGSVNIETATEAEIRQVWGNVGSSYENTGLCEVASKYFTMDAVANTFGQAEGSTRYESENAVISGGAAESQSFYSNGQAVGSMNTATALGSVADDWSNIKYVDYTIQAEKTGTYSVILGYNGNGADGMTVLYKLNNGANTALTLNNAGASWDAMNTATFQIHLNAGSNDLKISGTIINQSNWANQDYIDVLLVSADETEVTEYRTAVIQDASDSVSAGWTRIEAENAVITGGAAEAQSFYSAGYGVGSLNTGVAIADVASDWSNLKYVTFTVENVPADGIYYMLIQYNGDDDKSVLVKSGNITTVLSVPAVTATHQWNIPHAAVMPVKLKAGSNTISVSGTVEDISAWMNLDCIDISNTPVVVTGDTSRYEAEYGIITANDASAVEPQSFYSNGLGVGDLVSGVAYDSIAADLSNIYYVEFPVYAETAGEYTIDLAFNGNGADMYGVYRVNAGSPVRYRLSNAGSSWNTMNSSRITVTLEAGMNTVLLSGSTTGTWDDWVNFDYIDVTPVKEMSYTYGYYAQAGQTFAFALHTEEAGDMDIAAGDYMVTAEDGTALSYTGTVSETASYILDNGAVTIDNTGDYPEIQYTGNQGVTGLVTFGLRLADAAENGAFHTVTIAVYDTADDVYVLDYGLDVSLTDTTYGNGLLQNDSLEIEGVEMDNQTVTFCGVQAVTNALDVQGETYVPVYTAEGYADQAQGQFGNLSVTNSDTITEVTYHLKQFLEGIDRYTYGVQVGVKDAAGETPRYTTPVMEANITIMPATIVYYEDNFAAVITNGTAGAASDSLQGNGLDTQYGYDQAYGNDAGYSEGTYTVLNDTDKFAFTFQGTGFDLLARVTDADASVRVVVYSAEEVELKTYQVGDSKKVAAVRREGVDSVTPLRQILVNTYYENGTIYQVPVVSVELDNYGEYVAIAQYVGSATEEDNTNALYLDGIRIYRPLGNQTAEDMEAGQLAYPIQEQQANLLKVRNMVLGEGYTLSYETSDSPVLTGGTNVTASLVKISGNQFDILNGATMVEGFTGHVTSAEISQSRQMTSTTSLVTYVLNGPKDELYLTGEEYAWGTVVTPLAPAADFTQAMVQIGLKAVSGTVKVEYRDRAGNWSAIEGLGDTGTEDILSTATERYYSIPLDDLYQVGGKSVLLVRGTAGTVSLTSVKYYGVEFAPVTAETVGESAIVYDSAKTPFSIIAKGSTSTVTTLTFSVSSDIAGFTITGGTNISFTYGAEAELPADVCVSARACDGYTIYVVKMPKQTGNYTITAAGDGGYSEAVFTVE